MNIGSQTIRDGRIFADSLVTHFKNEEMEDQGSGVGCSDLHRRFDKDSYLSLH